MRMRILAGLLSSAIWLLASAQAQTYRSHIEHPIARYKMSARLDPVTKRVTGQYTLTWWNRTADNIPDIYFHLYLNAFKNLDRKSTRLNSSHITISYAVFCLKKKKQKKKTQNI